MEEETAVPTKKKSTPKDATEKKRKAPKVPANEVEPEEPLADQEVPVKPKKKRAPKVETIDEPPPPPTEEPVKKKKTKAPKPPPVPVDEDDHQIVDTPVLDEIEPPAEPKRKEKKAKKPKKVAAPSIDEFQDTHVEPLDQPYTEPTDESSPMESNSSDYERAIMDSFRNLASKVNFADYVGDDQWCMIHPPKSARTDQKSRFRKRLPGGNKDEKPGGKPAVPKGSLLTRFRNSVNTLVFNENNLLFGEQSNYDLADMEDEEDGVDTDNLHRYAQKLRELEDEDRQINPEYLVLRDGKTVYGVHESDADGKVKLASRKPIYDRQADQKPDEPTEKKKILNILKKPFSRGKDKDIKDSKSANATPDSRIQRKSSRKSLNTDLAPDVINDDPLNI